MPLLFPHPLAGPDVSIVKRGRATSASLAFERFMSEADKTDAIIHALGELHQPLNSTIQITHTRALCLPRGGCQLEGPYLCCRSRLLAGTLDEVVAQHTAIIPARLLTPLSFAAVRFSQDGTNWTQRPSFKSSRLSARTGL